MKGLIIALAGCFVGATFLILYRNQNASITIPASLPDNVGEFAAASTPVAVKLLTNPPAKASPLSDEISLAIRQYIDEPSLEKKMTYVKVFVRSGSDEASTAMIDTFRSHYKSGRSYDENIPLMISLHHLGILGTQSEIAATFLIQASDFKYWSNLREHNPRSEQIDHGNDIVMSGQSLMALALTGSEEAYSIAKGIRDANDEISKGLAGEIVSTIYCYDRKKQLGSKFDGADDPNDFQLWKQNEGKEWWDWYRAVRGIK